MHPHGELSYKVNLNLAIFPEAEASFRSTGRTYANVINITCVDELFRGWMRLCRGEHHAGYLDQLLPPEDRHVSAVTLLDGHPLALGWLGNVFHGPVRALGVTAFGESAALPDLYHKHHIDADAVLGAIAQLLFTA